jgi:hypothetical protein
MSEVLAELVQGGVRGEVEVSREDFDRLVAELRAMGPRPSPLWLRSPDDEREQFLALHRASVAGRIPVGVLGQSLVVVRGAA